MPTDPEYQGEVLWQTRVGKGVTMRGVQWGYPTAGGMSGNVLLAFSADGK